MPSLKVLIVDDEEELVSILVERLKFRGFSAEGAGGGLEALECAKSAEFDVAVIDVKMPEINGIETMRRLKTICPHTKIILLTGHGSHLEGDEGMAEGAYDYLVKPVNIEKLVEKIKSAAGSAN
jgi:two-component system OmpR family response regulator